jgi:hypothetical protein
VATVVSMETFHTTSPALQVAVPMVTLALQEVLSTVEAAASVLRPTEGELPTASSNLHLEVASTLEVAQLLETLSMAPHVLGLLENPVTGQNHSWLIIFISVLNKKRSLPVILLRVGSRGQTVW